MTPQELEKRLTELSPEQLRKFNADLGGGEKTVQERVTEFVHNPDHERGICQLLGLQTEQDKLTEAAVRLANAAATSATSARSSLIWSAIASIAALVAAVAALAGGCALAAVL